jgi:hypothetical protein
LALWEKLRIPWAHRAESAANARVSDLKLAANFVKSIETEDAAVNLEIKQVARQIEHIAESLDDRVEREKRARHT